MKLLQINEKGPDVTGEEFDKFEKIVEAKLPEDFKLFLEKQNPKRTIERSIVKGDNQYTVFNWLPLSESDELSLASTFEWTKDLLEGKYLAFALDAGDWLFVISINQNDYGQIFFCRPDQELSEIIKLADSFEEFIIALQPYDENK
ncbi:SMI1/KNR4 family protein [Ohtaekwangia koreensis]|uniref:SMI1 / KNR4 family (SUKH-1) n=1 Tax=Ohtaekwangia koreensis TaxID=688867 RepID=A0A1T5J8G3_9BACT|nr:SMI1/KNR4 family protein [Ohtaekwangia koreensis]SKC47562.1 SMI1 / KNR4 family (SUKH-1) [Ohtaekwangia koreensis]